MAGKDIIMATQEELKKLHVVRKAMENSITQNQAAEILGLSDRQNKNKNKGDGSI